MKKISPVVIVGLALTIVCLLLFITGPSFIRAVSNYAYDAFLRSVNEDPKSGRVVIVDLDDASLKRFGQWPWPRYLVARLTQMILDAGTSVLVFDIIFAEEDRTSPRIIQKDINRYLQLNMEFTGIPDNYSDFDQLFADSLKGGKTILGCFMKPSMVFAKDVDTSADPYYNSHFLALAKGEGERDLNDYLMQADGVIMPIPVLNKASQTAFFNAKPDFDGIVRSNPLFWAFGPFRTYPSLALEAVRLDRGDDQCIIEYNDNGVLSIRLKDLVIPTDLSGSLRINYRTVVKDASTGFASTFPTYSAADILEGKVDREAFDGKIVFIGTSAVGLKDVRATPVTQFFSGVEIHATMVDNILAGDMLWNPNWMVTVHSVVIVLMGTFLTIFISKGKSWLSFLISLAMILFSIKLSLVLLENYHIVFVPAWVILSVIIIYPVLTMIKFWQEELQKRQVRNMFGTMVSADVLAYLEDNPESFSLSGQKVEATMFFSDVSGFTRISESLEPDMLSDLLNRYLSPMTRIIMERRGYVDKYEGDLIMAEWGVPFPMDDHAVQACLSAIEQQKELTVLRPWLKKAFGHDIFVRMGINSGSVTAGNMGSDNRFQYTVMGDAVNQAARFEPANKYYGTCIIVGETTYRAAQDAVEARFLDKIVVQGKTRPINIYELLGKRGEIAPRKAKVVKFYEEALYLHRERKWDEAIKCLDGVLEIDSRDVPSVRMRERIMKYKDDPPADTWSGEFAWIAKDGGHG